MKVQGTDFEIADNDPNLVRTKEKHGDKARIEAIFGTTPDLRKLKAGQSVCWGDGKTYHFRLTKK